MKVGNEVNDDRQFETRHTYGATCHEDNGSPAYEVSKYCIQENREGEGYGRLLGNTHGGGYQEWKEHVDHTSD